MGRGVRVGVGGRSWGIERRCKRRCKRCAQAALQSAVQAETQVVRQAVLQAVLRAALQADLVPLSLGQAAASNGDAVVSAQGVVRGNEGLESAGVEGVGEARRLWRVVVAADRLRGYDCLLCVLGRIADRLCSVRWW
jgi:hypothetical protein